MSSMYGSIRFPLMLNNKSLNNKILFNVSNIISNYFEVNQRVKDGIVEYSSSEIRYGNFDELEKYLIHKEIPFDRFTEESSESSAFIRYYRPYENYDVEVDVDYERNPIIRTKDIFNYMHQYTSGSITQSDLIVEIAKLIKEKDPLLTKQIKPLEYYIKADDRYE